MGWYIIEGMNDAKGAIRDWMRNCCGWTNLEEHVVALEKGTHEGGVFYGAIKSKHDKVFGVVFLVRKDGPHEYAVKTMEESVGPYYYDCPKTVFDKLDPLSEEDAGHAREWREQVAAFHLMSCTIDQLPEGTHVRVNQPLVMTKGGNLLDSFEVSDFVLHIVGGEPTLFPMFDGEPKETLPIPTKQVIGKPFIVIK